MPTRSSRSSSAKKGFTLIEMMIVVVIFSLLSAGAVVTYRNFSRRQQVFQSAKNLQELMRFAQKKARVGEKPSGCQTLNGYRVSGTTNSSTLTLTADCTNQDYQVSTVNMIGNVRLEAALSTTFRVITGGVTGAGTKRVSLGSYTYAFEVNRGGEITQGDYE